MTIVTSDNPRSEDPMSIIDEIMAGIPAERAGAVVVEQDRRKAIARSLRAARPGDTVLIAGKGHEQGQIIGERRLPFDDQAVVVELLAEFGEEA